MDARTLNCSSGWRSSLGLAVVVAVFVVALLATPSAQAAQTNFCPPVYGSQVLISGNDRCASALFYSLTRVAAYTSNGNGVDHCAVGKQNAGGGGLNVIEPACGTPQFVQTACYSPRQGYATIVNRSSSAHYFFGIANYSNCSF